MQAVVLVVGGIAVITLVARLRVGKELVPWKANIPAATVEAEITRKPRLLDFTAGWCGPCQAMRTTTWADRGVANALTAYIPVQVDFDANPVLVKQYGVDAIPCCIVVDPSGRELKRSTGQIDAETFLQWLKS